MQITIIILAILILGKSKSLKDKEGFKVVSGSVFGIYYFILWPYFYYYLHLLHKIEIFIQTIFISFIFLSLFLVKGLLQIKNHLVPQVSLILIFLMTLAFSSVYEIEIKDKLAEHTNYFSSKLILTDKNILKKSISGPNKYYSLNIPEYWLEQKHKITGLPFYIPKEGGKGIIEFRPKCYDIRNKNISSIMDSLSSSITEGSKTEYQCYEWLNNNGYACKVVSYNSNHVQRVRWFGTNKKRMMELDFIAKNSTERDMQLVDSVFNSVKFNNLSEHTHSCVYSIDWF